MTDRHTLFLRRTVKNGNNDWETAGYLNFIHKIILII